MNHVRMVSFLLFFLICGVGVSYASIPPLPADADISAMVQQVNADSLMASVQHLVDFHTRHTFSDVTSDETGIGAARRWMYSEFQRHGLLPGNHEWESTFQGEEYSGYNVVGDRSGTGTEQALVMLTSHLDSRIRDIFDFTSFAPGADDNGSGTAALLEMARVLGDYQTVLPIRFVAFSGEEQLLMGSTVMADDFETDGTEMSAMINMDMIGNVGDDNGNLDSSFYVISDSDSRRNFFRYIKWVGTAYRQEVEGFTAAPANIGSDHYPFHEKGYRVCYVYEPLHRSSTYHSPLDLPEYMSPWYFKRVVGMLLGVAVTIAQAPVATDLAPFVYNVGNGTGLVVEWDAGIVPEGGTIAVSIELNEGEWDSLYYAEEGTSLQIDDLTYGAEARVTLSRIGANGMPSPFGPVTELMLSDAQLPPEAFDVRSTPEGPLLTWYQRYELLVTGYRIERATVDSEFRELATCASGDDYYLDDTAETGVMYLYRIRSRYGDEAVSAASAELPGMLASYDCGLMVIDATRELTTGEYAVQQDDEVDQWYRNMLSGYEIGMEYDLTDSTDADILLTDADLALYSPVLLHNDRLLTRLRSEDEKALQRYVENGGKLLLSGWQLSSVLNWESNSHDGLLRTVFAIDSVAIAREQVGHFNYAAGQEGYVDLVPDSSKIGILGGRLIMMDALYPDPMRDDFIPIELFSAIDSEDPHHNSVSGLKQAGQEPHWILLDVPLSFLEDEDAAGFLETAMTELGARESDVWDAGNSSGVPGTYHIARAWPNPFNASIHVEIVLPALASAKVEVFDILGRRVTLLKDGPLPAGASLLHWDATGHASGAYFIRLEADGVKDVRSVSLIR